MRVRVLVSCVLLITGCTASTSPAASTPVTSAKPVVQAVAAAGSVTALGDGKTHSASAARKLADAALELVSFPEGSARLTQRPAAAPASVSPETVVTSQVTRTRWWSVHGNMSDALSWFQGHVPTGLTVSQPSPAHLTWTGLPSFPMDAELGQDGDHVDVTISTQVIWTPAKTDIETIPMSVTSAQLDYDQGLNTFGHESRQVVTGRALRQLRGAINVNVPGWLGARLCPADNGGTATFTMQYGGHEMVFTIKLTGCRGIAVTADGKPQPYLECCSATGTNPSLDTVLDAITASSAKNAPKADAQRRQLLTGLTSVPRTLTIDKSLLRTLPLPATAARDKAPHRQPVDFRDPDQHLVGATQWWTIPRTRTASVDWLSTHLVPGFALAHVATADDDSTVMVEQPVGVYPSPVDVLLRLSGSGSTTEVQVVARKFYLPRRTPAETIPPTTKDAQLSFQHLQGPVRRVRITGNDLQQLVRVLNSRPAEWFGTPCTKPAADTKLGALFHTGRHTVNFYWYGSSCAMIVVVDGKNAPYLTGPPTALVERLVRETKR